MNSLDELIERTELEVFERWWKTDGIEMADYSEKSAARKGWLARSAHQRPCRGVAHPGCDYLAPCGSICDKCGLAV